MKHRKLSRLIDPALVMLFLVAGGVPQVGQMSVPNPIPIPLTITPAATACHIHSGLKANIKVTFLAKAVELEPKLFPGMVWAISMKEVKELGKAKGIFLTVTLELTELNVDEDLASSKTENWLIQFILVDQQGNKFEQKGIITEQVGFLPGQFHVWSREAETSLCITVVFGVPADAAGLKISMTGADWEISLMP